MESHVIQVETGLEDTLQPLSLYVGSFCWQKIKYLRVFYEFDEDYEDENAMFKLCDDMINLSKNIQFLSLTKDQMDEESDDENNDNDNDHHDDNEKNKIKIPKNIKYLWLYSTPINTIAWANNSFVCVCVCMGGCGCYVFVVFCVWLSEKSEEQKSLHNCEIATCFENTCSWKVCHCMKKKNKCF